MNLDRGCWPSIPCFLSYFVWVCVLLFYFKALALQCITREEVFSQSIANNGKLKTINGMKKEYCFGEGETGCLKHWCSDNNWFGYLKYVLWKSLLFGLNTVFSNPAFIPKIL